VVAYAAHIACQLGAHVVKVKPPTAHIEQAEAKKSYEKVPKDTLADRIRHVVQSCFNGKRIVIFSGGPAKGTDAVLAELREIHKGGGFGTIMGRNSFQRSRAEGAALLKSAIQIFGS
jgi:class I fructose-bisphosphate aldolase